MIKISSYNGDFSSVFSRAEMPGGVESIVSGIISDVIDNGDEAMKRYAAKFDHASIEDLEVTRDEIESAMATVDPELIRVMREAAENIKSFHSRQVRQGFVIADKPGVVMGQLVLPIEKVGLYVPGGTAAYPSSVLMNAIPAKLAGVSELVIVSPPTGGSISPAILAAANIAGVNRIFKAGGAQAIAALAYGTETIPNVDKIVGPGNAFVAEAKRQVFGRVAIDMIAGPSEILVIADANSNPIYVAADLLSQAEHGETSQAVLITESAELAGKVAQEIERQLELLPRSAIARRSIDDNGRIITVSSIYEAIDIANAIAPEHLELTVDEPFSLLSMVKNAGSVFLGRSCPEALGDYLAGPNHTLPTLGTARFSSPLSVDDFVKKTQYSYFSAEALAKVGSDVMLFAEKEGLDAHKNSVKVRLEGKA